MCDHARAYALNCSPDWNSSPEWLPDALLHCEGCGGYSDGARWHWRCSKCGKEVEEGGLRGLFVPHLCPECHAAEVEHDIKCNNICGICGQPRCCCCC
jgi:hypothetical protein